MDVAARGKVEPQHILIERGDVLFVRNDIAHRGCENLGNYPNRRIHILIVPTNLHDEAATKSVPLTDFPPCPKWCEVSQKFVTPFK